MKNLFLATLILSISLVSVSCKDKKSNITNHTESKTSISESSQTNTETSENVITFNEGKYPRDIKLFENEVLSNHIKSQGISMMK